MSTRYDKYWKDYVKAKTLIRTKQDLKLENSTAFPEFLKASFLDTDYSKTRLLE